MCTASFVWSHNCVPCLPIPCIGPDVLSQCQISQKLISPNPCPLSFILNSSQYSSLLDHLLISFPLWFLGWHLTILSQPDLYAFTFFLPLFFFLQSTGFNIWTFCVDRRNVTVPGTNHWRCLLAFDKAYQLCYIVADAFLVGTVVQNSLWKPTVSLHSPFAALFSHEWMSSVCNSPGAAIGFWLQTVHYSFFFFSKLDVSVYVCMCTLIL